MSLRFTLVTILAAFTVAACGFTDSETETSSPETAPESSILVPPKGPKRIFVTERVFTGALGGVVGADAECQAEANVAGIGGSYRAWLSTSERSAASRLASSDGPYVLVTGEVVAKTFDALTSGKIEHAIDRTASGTEPPPSRGETACGGNLVWTSTRSSGEYSGSDCRGWTSDAVNENEFPSLGIAGAVTSQWTDWCYGTKCNYEAHLYCIQQ